VNLQSGITYGNGKIDPETDRVVCVSP